MITNILILALLYTFYRVFLGVYRVAFHPLAKFPGPRAAALSNAWQYALQKRGRGEIEFEKLHREYGTKALRIGPNEIHITDPSLYKVIYNQKALYLKDSHFYKGFNVHNVFSIINPQQHKERRRLLNPFFSKAGIFKAEGMIADKVAQLKKKIELLSTPERNHPINASNAFRCLTIDMITHYAFAESWTLIEKSDDDFYAPILVGMDVATEGFWDFVYLPWVRVLAALIPRSALSIFNKDAAKFLWLLDLGKSSYEAFKKGVSHETPVIFDALSAAVPEEKQILDEASGLVIAGSDTEVVWHCEPTNRRLEKLPEYFPELFKAL
ncbi:hypothetical protein NUW58_g2739 [Xylaria curta]|uniref:Uncharacterized protein n=1 Tax=Xylaria curta TaxID=42375 RepID=A0ACC1PFG5_9PEZI|nr:hypothetical protein NUW58_g2739 [Xylaria curta]